MAQGLVTIVDRPYEHNISAAGRSAGWNRRGIFYSDVLAQTQAVIPNSKQPMLEHYADFVPEELPVLLHRYYFGLEQLVDFYPGPQSMLFLEHKAAGVVNLCSYGVTSH
jgi:hypothetical protein